MIRNYGPIKRRADLLALFEEFKRVLIEELDYVQEARNAAIIRANFAATPGVYIPEPYPEISSRRVLIMERISGIKISDIAALDRAGVDRSEIAQRFYAAYLKQWFLDGVFHAATDQWRQAGRALYTDLYRLRHGRAAGAARDGGAAREHGRGGD